MEAASSAADSAGWLSQLGMGSAVVIFSDTAGLVNERYLTFVLKRTFYQSNAT
jgi:hypothetical protein